MVPEEIQRSPWRSALNIGLIGAVTVVLLSLIGALRVFGQMWIMTEGGPQNSTVSYVMYLYRVAFHPTRDFEFGYASALAFVLAAVIFVLTACTQRFSRAVEQ